MAPFLRSTKTILLLLSLLMCQAMGIQAQAPYLLKDINTTTVGSQPAGMTSVGDLLFFVASDSSGQELWATDGSHRGTRMVKDIYPGEASSSPSYLAEVNGELLFFASSPEYGLELWKSNGTAKGTALVRDITPGEGGSVSAHHFSFGSELIFSLRDSSQTFVLYRSDGTPGGTYPVVSADSGLSNPSHFYPFQGKAYFNAGGDLWSYDPLAGLAEKVIDFPAQEGIPVPFGVFQGEMYFSTVLAAKIYKTDGTAPGTQVVYDFGLPNGGQDQAKQGVEYNGALYYVAKTDAFGYELWKTDGTSAGTQIVADILPGSGSSYPYRPMVLNGLLYFTAADSANGRELWRTDGTAAGTQMVLDLCPGVRGGLDHNIIVFQDKVYFSGDTGLGWELMEFDPHTDQFRLLEGGKSGHPVGYPDGFVIHDDLLFFSGNSIGSGNELWKTDGTDSGTRQVKDIATRGNGSSPRQFVGLRDKLVFVADDGAHGSELWVTDGTAVGTELLEDIWLGPASSLPLLQIEGNGELVFFRATDSLHGPELWRTDGSTAGTQRVLDLWPGKSGGFTGQASFGGDRLFFAGNDSIHQFELWVTDGTAQGTMMLTNVPESTIPPGIANEIRVRAVSNGAYFTHYFPGAGNELWFTDGTVAGTRFMKDLLPGPDFHHLDFDFALEHKGMFYFSAKDDQNRERLWRTDGSTAGTEMVMDLNSAGWADLRSPVIYKDEIYFLAKADSVGFELFRTDGTQAGTQLVKDIFPGAANGVGCTNPPQLLSSQGLLWFQANDGIHGCELWISDGTAEGTKMLKDLNPDGNANPKEFTTLGNKVYFSATNSDCTDELFVSDGTAEGTEVEAVFNPGKSGEVSRLFQWRDQLFFSATAPNLTKELWTLHPSDDQEVVHAIPDLQLLVYPNPALEELSAAWEDDHRGTYEYQVLDLLGKVMLEGEGTKSNERAEHHFRVGDLAPGVYTLRIKEPTTEYSQKFMVAR